MVIRLNINTIHIEQTIPVKFVSFDRHRKCVRVLMLSLVELEFEILEGEDNVIVGMINRPLLMDTAGVVLVEG